MRRRKKEKTLEKSSTSSTDESPGELGRGRSAKAAKNLDAISRSPPQQRKRSLLGLSSMRDLVEQVQDSLTKTKQQDASSASSALAGGSAHSSAEKSSRHGAAPSAAGLSAPASPATLAAAATATAAAAAPAASGAATHTAAAITTIVAVAPKKKVLDLKLLPSGTSLTLRMKKQTPFTPSPSEFKARERPYAVDHQRFCGVCAAPFTLMVRRQRCQVCGESVCAQCSTDKRYVEGQKGLQRVCDICIVEGPVVLDDIGIYPVGCSPADTPVAPPRPAPPRSSSSSSNAIMGRPPPTHHHDASALYDSAPKPRDVRDDTAASVRALRAAGDTVPKATTMPTSGGIGVGRTPGGGSEKRFIDSRAVRPPKSPSSAVAGSLFPIPSRVLVGGSLSNKSNGVGIIGGGGGVPAEAALSLAATAEFEAVSIAGTTALGEEDGGDAEGGPPSSVSSSKARKRGKKARRAGTPASEAVKTPAEKRQFWSGGQSLSEYFGKSSGTAGTPLSRSSRSTPRGASAGTSNHASLTSAFPAAGGESAGASVSANNDSGGGGSSEGNWVSITKRRPLEGGGQAQTVGHGSAFVRDFIRGAGIHRLDPRRLTGSLAACASWTGLDKLWAGLWVLLLWLLEVEGEPTRGAGGRSRRSGGARGGHYQHQSQNAAASRGWRPGRRFLFVGSLALVACYRRYQVTHPELTTGHVLREASSVLFALTLFFAHAVTDLPRDACGAIVPSLCGTRESRLQAALDRASSSPSAGMASPDAAAGLGLGRAGAGVLAGAGFRLADEDDCRSDCGGDMMLKKGEREEDDFREGWGRGSDDGGLVEGGDKGGGSDSEDSEVVGVGAGLVGHELDQYFSL